MRSRKERDDQPITIDDLDGPIARLDAQLFACRTLDDHLESLAHRRHMYSLRRYVSGPKYE